MGYALHGLLHMLPYGTPVCTDAGGIPVCMGAYHQHYCSIDFRGYRGAHLPLLLGGGIIPLSFNQRIIDWAFDPRKPIWYPAQLLVKLVACTAWFIKDTIIKEIKDAWRK